MRPNCVSAFVRLRITPSHPPSRQRHIPPCRQLHAIDGRLAEPSQYAPQYSLPGAAGQLQPGCAHFSIFFSAIETPLAPFAVAEEHTPTQTQNQSHAIVLTRTTAALFFD